MIKKHPFHYRYAVYMLWIILLMLQACFTDLTPDEAYYWCYSQELDWGYFDHPPVLAFFIHTGYLMIPNELGVRLFSVIFSIAVLILWEKIIQPKNLNQYFLLFSSVTLIHFIGFLAIPDSPFILFFSLYLIIYREYLKNPEVKKSVLLGIIIALMVLSKYHGMLVVLLTILSNPKLLKDYRFYLAGLITLLLVLPHFLWQYHSGFPSITFHLFERSTDPYSVSFTTEYLLYQLFTFGPFAGILFFIAAGKIKSTHLFEKTLRFIFWGVYIFFLLMTFKGKVEGHWTFMAILPGMYFGIRFLESENKFRKTVIVLSCFGLFFSLAARVIILLEFDEEKSPLMYAVTKDFHTKKEMEMIHKKAGQIPVGFMNSYKKASLYRFYSKEEGFSMNNVRGRKDQYTLWNYEEKFQGKTVMIIPNYEVKNIPMFEGYQTSYALIKNFRSYPSIRFIPLDLPESLHPCDSIELSLKIINSAKNKINTEANPDLTSRITYQFFQGRDVILEGFERPVLNSMIGKKTRITLKTPEKEGDYYLTFSLQTGWLPPSFNSEKYFIRIEKK